MRVDKITNTPDSLRQQQYYAGTHLALYPKPLQERAKVVTKVDSGIFKRYLEKENGLRDLLTTSTTKEKIFLDKRIAHQKREDLMQQLNYMNGVHYSAAKLDIQHQQSL